MVYEKRKRVRRRKERREGGRAEGGEGNFGTGREVEESEFWIWEGGPGMEETWNVQPGPRKAISRSRVQSKRWRKLRGRG